MLAFTIATALVSLASFSAAAPAIEKRQETTLAAGEVTICTGPNKSGECLTQDFKFNECIILPETYDKVLTFIPGHQVLCRVTNSQDTCTAHGDVMIEYPGSTHFNKYNGMDYSDMTSFLCQQCTACH